MRLLARLPTCVAPPGVHMHMVLVAPQTARIEPLEPFVPGSRRATRADHVGRDPMAIALVDVEAVWGPTDELVVGPSAVTGQHADGAESASQRLEEVAGELRHLAVGELRELHTVAAVELPPREMRRRPVHFTSRP